MPAAWAQHIIPQAAGSPSGPSFLPVAHNSNTAQQSTLRIYTPNFRLSCLDSSRANPNAVLRSPHEPAVCTPAPEVSAEARSGEDALRYGRATRDAPHATRRSPEARPKNAIRTPPSLCGVRFAGGLNAPPVPPKAAAGFCDLIACSELHLRRRVRQFVRKNHKVEGLSSNDRTHGRPVPARGRW